MLYLWLSLKLVDEVEIVNIVEAFLELHEHFEPFFLRELKIFLNGPEDDFNLLLRSLSRETYR